MQVRREPPLRCGSFVDVKHTRGDELTIEMPLCEPSAKAVHDRVLTVRQWSNDDGGDETRPRDRPAKSFELKNPDRLPQPRGRSFDLRDRDDADGVSFAKEPGPESRQRSRAFSFRSAGKALSPHEHRPAHRAAPSSNSQPWSGFARAPNSFIEPGRATGTRGGLPLLGPCLKRTSALGAGGGQGEDRTAFFAIRSPRSGSTSMLVTRSLFRAPLSTAPITGAPKAQRFTMSALKLGPEVCPARATIKTPSAARAIIWLSAAQAMEGVSSTTSA